MTITYTAQFNTDGIFRPGDDSGRKLFERYRWWNQSGNGVGFEFNLIFFYFDIEFVFAPKKEASDVEV